MSECCQKRKIGEYYIDMGVYSCYACLRNKHIKTINKLKLFSGHYFCCGAVGYTFRLEEHDWKCRYEYDSA